MESVSSLLIKIGVYSLFQSALIDRFWRLLIQVDHATAEHPTSRPSRLGAPGAAMSLEIPPTAPLDRRARRKLPWICGRTDHCRIGAEARPERD